MLKHKHAGRTQDALEALNASKTSAEALSQFMIDHKDEWGFLADREGRQKYQSAPLHVRALNPFLSDRNQERLIRFIESDK